jgi:hypothetical protein
MQEVAARLHSIKKAYTSENWGNTCDVLDNLICNICYTVKFVLVVPYSFFRFCRV